MFRTHRLCTGFLHCALIILTGSFVLCSFAAGQTPSAELPADCSAYASVPLPAEAETAPRPTIYPGCASYRSYQGIGRPVNYADARACAWRERLAQKAGLGQNEKEPTAWVVGGSLILADIYFNGAGVDRNVRLALRFACEAEPEMVKLALRDIAKSDHSLGGLRPFEFCDYAATTFTMNFCSSYESDIEDDRRSRYYKSLKASMNQEQRRAFEKLLAAEDAYVEAHAAEVDQGGTIRTIRTLASRSILRNLFHSEVVHFEQKKWPGLSKERMAAADGLLRREYESKLKQLRAQTQEQIEGGAVTAANLSGVERVWEGYREAWVAFARLRNPAAAAAVGAEITLERYRLLKTIGY